MSKEKKTYYTLAPNMFGRTSYTANGAIPLNEGTSQKDLKTLYDLGMTNCITQSEMTGDQIEIIEKKKSERIKAEPKKEAEKPVVAKKKNVATKKEEKVDE